jgi:mannitol-1-phosphate 5-dehydrogenase
MKEHIFTGFGFGPIQSGLFVDEAYNSKNFKRIVIAEIDQKLVDAVRANGGCYYMNVARQDGIETFKIEGIELYNPSVESDREKLIEAISLSTEICTSLPSVDFYDLGANSVSDMIAEGLQKSTAKATIIYTAENNNHAAEILQEKVQNKIKSPIKTPVQFLNTVIGKMSQVITDAQEIKSKNIKTIAPGIDRAFLVEEFNKILVTKCTIPNYEPGIKVFIEKQDLLPFEEAKLYGHNAIHALLAYLGTERGCKKMSELANHPDLMQIARDAFIKESGAALIKKYAKLNDELFTEKGYTQYADDLLGRMTNPYLDDAVQRAARDPKRKLSLNDRIFGTIAIAMQYGINPVNMAKGAAAGLKYLINQELNLSEISNNQIIETMQNLWKDQQSEQKADIIDFFIKTLN